LDSLVFGNIGGGGCYRNTRVPLNGGRNKGSKCWNSHTEETFVEVGYVLRGGSPSAYDRLMAHTMGNFAYELLSKGKLVMMSLPWTSDPWWED